MTFFLYVTAVKWMLNFSHVPYSKSPLRRSRWESHTLCRNIIKGCLEGADVKELGFLEKERNPIGLITCYLSKTAKLWKENVRGCITHGEKNSAKTILILIGDKIQTEATL